MIEHSRPELKQTIIFGEEPRLDQKPTTSPKGRLIAGPEFSEDEYEKLWARTKTEWDAKNLASKLLVNTTITTPYLAEFYKRT